MWWLCGVEIEIAVVGEAGWEVCLWSLLVLNWNLAWQQDWHWMQVVATLESQKVDEAVEGSEHHSLDHLAWLRPYLLYQQQ